MTAAICLIFLDERRRNKSDGDECFMLSSSQNKTRLFLYLRLRESTREAKDGRKEGRWLGLEVLNALLCCLAGGSIGGKEVRKGLSELRLCHA
jgi:hypothetical protein